MSANTTIHLRDTEKISVSLMELEVSKCVALCITVKDGYRTMSEMRITSDNPEQEEALRVLAQAWHEYKATLEQIASL
jgi:hypothetical protein